MNLLFKIVNFKNNVSFQEERLFLELNRHPRSHSLTHGPEFGPLPGRLMFLLSFWAMMPHSASYHEPSALEDFTNEDIANLVSSYGCWCQLKANIDAPRGKSKTVRCPDAV